MSQTSPPTSVPGNTTFFNSTGTSAPPSVSGTGSPLISQDQSAFSQYVLGQTGSYNVTIGALPGVTGGNQPTTIGQALQEFMNLSPAELQALEMQLWDAGYYIDGNGQPIDAQDIRFGVPGDPASWTAFARALGAASSSGTSLESLLSQRSSQGAGINNALPSPVTGGGHTYTIDLSNPTTIKYVADTMFQSALGRNATASEVSDITSKLRSQETSQGLAQEQGAEQQSRTEYQTQVNQRNISYETHTNPNLGRQIPTGPFNTPQDWAAALLGYMNLPVTTSNVAAITSWANATGRFGDGSYNPLATERPEGGSTSGAGGVQQFQNWAQGLEGTASMLMNVKYQGLVAALLNGNASDAVKNDTSVKQELSSWSGGQITSLTVSSQTTQQAATAAQSQQQAQQMAQAGVPGSGIAGPPLSQAPPAVAAAGQAAMPPTVNPQDVNQGQQPPNPGDAYINPVTVYDTSPATEESQAYQEATTGANRIPYGGYEYLKAFNAVAAMIRNGGPTG